MLNMTAGSGRSILCSYESDTGCVYHTAFLKDTPHYDRPAYGESNTVGCGVDAKNKTIWFTKDGQNLGTDPFP